jgi:hypothetical protein
LPNLKRYYGIVFIGGFLLAIGKQTCHREANAQPMVKDYHYLHIKAFCYLDTNTQEQLQETMGSLCYQCWCNKKLVKTPIKDVKTKKLD